MAKPVLTADTRVEGLKRLRDRLAAAIDDPNTTARDLAALSRQFTAVIAEIEDAEPHTPEGSVIDKINDRRARRGKTPARTDGSDPRRQ